MAFIALGVTGGIGAYKSVEVCRGLQKRGHDVVAVMSHGATNFVGPLTFEAITRRPVITSQWMPGANATIEHIAIAEEARRQSSVRATFVAYAFTWTGKPLVKDENAPAAPKKKRKRT